jgi:hypothetical protein
VSIKTIEEGRIEIDYSSQDGGEAKSHGLYHSSEGLDGSVVRNRIHSITYADGRTVYAPDAVFS